MLDGLKPRPRSVTPSLCTLPRQYTTRIKFGLCDASSSAKHTPELITVTPTALVPASLCSHGYCIFSAGGHSSSGWTMAQASPCRLLSKPTFLARGVVGGGVLPFLIGGYVPCLTRGIIPPLGGQCLWMQRCLYELVPREEGERG